MQCSKAGADGLTNTCPFIIGAFEPEHLAKLRAAAQRCCGVRLLGFSLSGAPLRCQDTFGNNGRSGVCSPLQSYPGERPRACGCLATTYLAFITIVFTYSSTFYSIHVVAFKAERSVCSSKLPSQSRSSSSSSQMLAAGAPSSPRAALPATAGSRVNPHS
ncbi:hypothetical protein AV530_003581 [Patagioenas fasciata monilis]|uniref:Uncharacterized protein n=1 Tax=Patagioenas fasciata monilis TaxID=372326 RepID=A0A1V4KY56_PATFA|nr:hypothetical protein AV530_003581 [Patagioenas fasciata monilis]